MLSPILSCISVPAAIDHYTAVLGFELAWQMPPGASGETEFACVKLGGAQILLGITDGFVEPADLGKRGVGVQIHIDLPDDLEIDRIYQTAKAGGAEITREIETRDWGERAFNVRDKDGYNLMIAQQLSPAG